MLRERCIYRCILHTRRDEEDRRRRSGKKREWQANALDGAKTAATFGALEDQIASMKLSVEPPFNRLVRVLFF